MEHPEYTRDDFLADCDADARAEWAMDLDSFPARDATGRQVYQPVPGDSYQAQVLRAAYGDTPEAQFGADKEGLKAFYATQYRKSRDAGRKERMRSEIRRRASVYMNAVDAIALLSRMSFALQWHGTPLTTMITIAYGKAASEDQRQCAEWLSQFNVEAGRVLKRNAENAESEYRYHYVYAHENARDEGFHTHLATRFPDGPADLKKYFEEWAFDFWRRQLGPQTPRSVIDVRQKDSHRHRVSQHWHWGRYLIKTLDPAAITDVGEQQAPLARLLKLPHTDALGPIATCQRWGSSQSLSEREQRKAAAAGFPLEWRLDNEWCSHWDNGWELELRRDWTEFQRLIVQVTELGV